MKIVVLNGSPKSTHSVTMQYVRFLAKRFPQHEFPVLPVCPELRRLEEAPAAFQDVLRAVEQADAVLWAFPLYYFLVHAHYKRFIELVFERGARAAFAGKYAAAFSTSIRFFDHTAHNYIHAVCDDLGMNFVGSYSAEMYDLLKEPERQRLVQFAEQLFAAVTTRPALPKTYQPIEPVAWTYQPGPSDRPPAGAGQKIAIVTDEADERSNLARMVARLAGRFAEPPEIVNLRAIAMRGGCLGCIQCCLDNVCVFRDADDVFPVYRRLMAADALIFAGSIHDRCLSSRWKMFFDRGFFSNHVPVFPGKQIGLVVSGPLRQIANLRQVLAGYIECQGANPAGVVTDECGVSGVLDRQLDSFAEQLAARTATGYIAPPTFLSVAGRRLFRDEIWATLRLVFRADHRYYKRHGLYAFPHRSLKTRLTDALLGALLLFPAFRRKFRSRLKEEMVKPLAKTLDRL